MRPTGSAGSGKVLIITSRNQLVGIRVSGWCARDTKGVAETYLICPYEEGYFSSCSCWGWVRREWCGTWKTRFVPIVALIQLFVSVWGTRPSMLDCHVLKEFGMYMIGILNRQY